MKPGWVAAATVAALAASRWALAPQYPHSFDGVNFALALVDFDPSRHQPQPPGYVLFVGLARLLEGALGSAEAALIGAGLVGACAAALFLRRQGAAMFGEAAGVAAMALAASDPVLWFGGLTNPVRQFLAASSAGVAWLAWRALERPESNGRLLACFAGLGIAAGFRPETPVVLSPLLLYCWRRTGGGAGRLAAGAAAFAAVAMPWLALTAWEVGGAERLMVVFRAYAEEQFRGTSALFGAPYPAVARMAWMAAAWTFLGAAAWLWALPPRVRDGTFAKGRGAFLAMWFVPAFLFLAIVHIGDPDQALAAMPPLAAAGGAVLARLRRWQAATAAAVALHVLVFFFPVGELSRASSYAAVAEVDRGNRDVLEAIRELRRGGPLTIVWYGGPVTFRHLAYYFPDDYVVTLPGAPGSPEPDQPMHIFYRRRPLPPPLVVGVLRPGSRRVVCVMPPGTRPDDSPEWRGTGAVLYRDLGEGAEAAIGPHRLIPGRK